MDRATWQCDGAGQLSGTLHDMRLVIRRFGKYFRYIILEGANDLSPGSMLSSGTLDNIDAAVLAVDRAAWRAHTMLTIRRQRLAGASQVCRPGR